MLISSEGEADTARAAAELGMPGMACDVADEAALRAPVGHALAELGGIDLLVSSLSGLRGNGAINAYALAKAGAVVFLASPAGAFVTGHNLVVDGGTLITDGS